MSSFQEAPTPAVHMLIHCRCPPFFAQIHNCRFDSLHAQRSVACHRMFGMQLSVDMQAFGGSHE